MPASKEPTRPILLASTEGMHGGYSGYGQLGRRMSVARFIETERPPIRGFSQRVATAILTRLSLVRWTRLSSLRLEAAGLRELRGGQGNLLHFLWGDRDVCFADLMKPKGIPLVVSMHNCERDLQNLFPARWRLSRVDAWIIVAECQRAWLAQAGIPTEKIHTVHHGVDTKYFVPVKKKRDGRFRVLILGSWRRDFEAYEQIFRAIPTHAVEFRCRMEKPWMTRWRRFPNFTPLPSLSDEELLREYQASDCFLLAAEDSTANNALIEAMACGLPVISSKVGGIPEYLGDDYPGLFPTKSPGIAVEKIQRLIRNPETRLGWGHQARLRAERICWEGSVRQIQAVYHKVAAR